MTGSPLVIGPVVVVNPGVRLGAVPGPSAVAAYDRVSGKKKWAGPAGRAAYASPMKAVLAGKEQVLVFDADGLAGYDPADGNRLWSVRWKTPMDMNSSQPLVVGPNRVIISSEKDKGAAVYEIAESGGKWTATQLWKTRKFAARYACPVLHQGHVFGLMEGRLTCLDAGTGEVKWSEGMYGNGQILLAGDKLVVTNEKGSVHLVAADPGEYRELGSVKVFDERTWNMPALARNQLFVRNHHDMACLELK
jgi:outer membrane protein assembly factor BamB